MAEFPAIPRPLWKRTGRLLLAQYLPAAALVLTLLVLWELATHLWEIQPWLLPAPSAIWKAGLAARGLLGPHIWQTAQETLWGFLLALGVGLALGLLIEFSPLVRYALYPLLVISQTIPIIAIAPLLVIWLGYGIWPKIIVVGLVCFFPIVVNTADGLRSADPELIALLRTMGASEGQIFQLVRWPGALPMIFSGIKIAITYSVVGAILGEWVGASRGLGVFMLRATNSFRTDWVFASIAITAILSVCLFGLVSAAERLSLRWYYAAGRGERWEEL
ncbi:MAG: ABC transporter permease [Chloroflexi bacterium]|nr:ABC transporter permease [Chloroflexota bacterium]